MRITIRNGEPYAFAGLFDTWTRPEGQKNMTLTCCNPFSFPTTPHRCGPIQFQQWWAARKTMYLTVSRK
ncbi:SOS response-associated peptidase [Brevibacillus borstelensis]|uniref:SOS response-associated peptidase n=1 Tax=Brevibacillus borstelensis TaxID=45462 RepID=UPI002100610E|nr:SOS response-associated peptidase [Brevibacillus borstelensis]MED1881257.1 SOS response-associated peptidase [Brevibacillus borstelensis]